MIKKKVTLKRNGVLNLNIRSIAMKNQEEYFNNLKMQAIRLQIEKIVHLDPMLKSLFSSKKKKYARSLYRNQINRSYAENVIQQVDSNQRAKSTEGLLFGEQCSKCKRLNQGTFKARMNSIKIIRRFRKLVIAVCLLLTYFRYYPLIKKGKRFSRPRVSILRSKAMMLDRPLLMPQIVQSDQINSEDESQTSKEPIIEYKKKYSSLGNFDTFLKRPIQQFILRQNTEHYSQKRICKTEHSQVQSMYNFNRKLKLDKVYQKSSSIKLLSMN